MRGTNEKTLHNYDASEARANVHDTKFFGDGDMFKLLSKASSKEEGWMKSTKAMEIDGVGCMVQCTTQQKNPDGSYAVAETSSFVPGVRIVSDENSNRRLSRSSGERSGLREGVAAVSHGIWAHWMKYLFSKCTNGPDGGLTIPSALVARWKKQVGQSYADLTDGEKDSDRDQADKILALLR